MISISGFMNVDMNCWLCKSIKPDYNHTQVYVICAKTAIINLNFDSNMGTCLVEIGEVEVETHL